MPTPNYPRLRLTFIAVASLLTGGLNSSGNELPKWSQAPENRSTESEHLPQWAEKDSTSLAPEAETVSNPASEPSAPWASPERYYELFEPFEVGNASLSPDGTRAAFSVYHDGTLSLVTIDLQNRFKVLTNIVVWMGRGYLPDTVASQADRKLSQSYLVTQTPPRILWMQWADNDRLVFHSNASEDYASGHGLVAAIDVDGSNFVELASPRLLERTELRTTYDRNKSYSSWNRQFPGGVWDTSLTRTWSHSNHLRSPAERSFLSNRYREHDLKYQHFQDTIRFRHQTPDQWSRYELNHYNSIPFSPRTESPPHYTYELTIRPHPISALRLSEDRSSVYVRAGEDQRYEVYAVDIRTAEKKLVREEKLGGDRRALLDHDFEANISIPYTTLSAYPHEYDYDKPRFFSLWRWKSLDRYLGPPNGTPFDFSLSPDNVAGDRAVPLGFDPSNTFLYFASDQGRETFALYKGNLETGEVIGPILEDPDYDLIPLALHDFSASKALVREPTTGEVIGVRYDANTRTARWLDPDLQFAQTRLESWSPGSSVEILEWDRTREHFLARLESPSDPGGFYLFNRTENSVTPLSPQDFGLERHQAWTSEFSFTTRSGRRMPVRLTVPPERIQDPTPIVILLSENIWDRLPTGFDREAVSLSKMGYVVVRFSGAGAWGYGQTARKAFHEGGEELFTDELIELTNELEKRFPIDRERVALIGEGIGGYLAMRSLHAKPEAFRCAIALNSPLEPLEWIEDARWAANRRGTAAFGQSFIESALDTDWPTTATLQEARQRGFAADLQLLQPYLEPGQSGSSKENRAWLEQITRPVQLFAGPSRPSERNEVTSQNPQDYMRALQKNGAPVEVHTLSRSTWRERPLERAQVYAHMAGFLNSHMFDYDAEVDSLEYFLEAAVVD